MNERYAGVLSLTFKIIIIALKPGRHVTFYWQKVTKSPMLSEGDSPHFHRSFSISSIGVPSGHRLVLFSCSVGVPSGQWFMKVSGGKKHKTLCLSLPLAFT